MGHDWIKDVLIDLEAYAEQNDLDEIAHELAALQETVDKALRQRAEAQARRIATCGRAVVVRHPSAVPGLEH